MKNKWGGIVAIEPKTGEVLALVSAPSYNPNLLVGRERSKNYSKLSLDTISKHTFLPDKLTPNYIVVDLGVHSGGFTNPIIEKYTCNLIGVEAIQTVYTKY